MIVLRTTNRNKQKFLVVELAFKILSLSNTGINTGTPYFLIFVKYC